MLCLIMYAILHCLVLYVYRTVCVLMCQLARCNKLLQTSVLKGLSFIVSSFTHVVNIPEQHSIGAHGTLICRVFNVYYLIRLFALSGLSFTTDLDKFQARGDNHVFSKDQTNRNPHSFKEINIQLYNVFICVHYTLYILKIKQLVR